MENKLNLSDVDLGFEDEDEATNVASTRDISEERKRADVAFAKASATAALKASIEAEESLAQKESEKTYAIEKKRFMLNKCKSDKPVLFIGNKLYAQFFGDVYTWLYNGIPVTVKFDGSKQYYPEFIYNFLMEKINEVANSNVPKVDIDDRTK